MRTDVILNMDCMEGMRNIPSESVDLIATDVPYLCTARGGSGNMSGYWTSQLAKDGRIFADNAIAIEEYLPEFYRVLKPSTHCYIMCNNFNLVHFLKVIDGSPFHFTKCLIWDKVSKICGRYYMGQFEYIILIRKGADRPVNDCGIGDILRFQSRKTKDRNGDNIHDSEKPVPLFRTLIRQSTQPGEVVLDPFMGSGTTAVAAIAEKRHFLGFEINPEYWNVANKRISEIKSDLTLF